MSDKPTKPFLPPPAFRGNCDCGRWLIVLKSIKVDNPLECECGQAWFWEEDKLRKEGRSDTKEHLQYRALERQQVRHMQEMQALADVILNHGGPKFPLLTFDTPAEAVDALVRWIKNGKS